MLRHPANAACLSAILFVAGAVAAEKPLAPAALPPTGWFVFAPKNTSDAGAIGLAGWLDAPAGRRGPVLMRGDRLEFADGTPLKFWGVNHGNLAAAPARAEANARADWYAKYGINAVRLHKFAWHADGLGAADDSTQLVPELWERMDYYVAALKQRGIYHAWSHIFGHRVRPGDRGRLLAYEEVAALRHGPDFLHGSTYGVVNLFEDMQALNIDLTVNLLEHRNPHTGLRAADDPGLALIELQNEDNAWWTAGETLKVMPTYRAKLATLFCDWLRAKYGTADKLATAWGPAGLDLWPEISRNETLAKDNIYPVPDRRYYQPDVLAKSASRQRLLDCARFLHERQDAFYQKFVAAIRATGYKGLLVGSCWKADNGLPHYYNLLADYRVGLIDRHTYYGGRDHRLTTGQPFGNAASMVGRGNLGLLGVGLLQVLDRPFVLSEWNSKPPNEWVAEGPPIVAFYGLGLQGWDGSFQYQSQYAGFTDVIDPRSGGVYNVNSPAQMGLYPLLARAVYRGDVREGASLLPRRQVSVAQLERGAFGFAEKANVAGDTNVLEGTVPAEALAVGKVELEFTDREATAVTPPELIAWREKNRMRSNTRELLHDRDAQFFTVSTSGTKALVGTGAGREHVLGELRLAVENPFAVIVITDAERTADLESTKRVLIGTMARVRNSGQRYDQAARVLEDRGSAPVIVEGVKATLTWRRAARATLHILDHDGLRTGRTLAVDPDGTLSLDGAGAQAYLYELVWP